MKKLFDELVDDIKTKDERGKIITLHLYIEEWLNEILKKYANVPKIRRRLTFWQKVKLIHAIDLIDGLTLHNILLINKLRNLFSHTRKPNEQKKIDLISSLKIRPASESKGLSILEVVCIQTMFDLDDVYNSLKDKN